MRVSLGNIDLVRSYSLDIGVWILHLLLMSWASETVDVGVFPTWNKVVNRSVLEVFSEVFGRHLSDA